MKTGVTYGQPTSDRVVADLQSLIRELSAVPFLEGKSLKNVALAAGATQIQHGLGRAPRGWIVISFSGAAASDFPRQTAADAEVLELTVTNAATVSLWVY